MKREALYSALFALLEQVPGVVTRSRRLRHWSDVGPSEQPALFLAQGRQNATPGDPARGVPTKWLLHADVYLYVRTGSHGVPGSQLNPLLDAIEAALATAGPLQRTQTLGGLAEHCWIEGDIDTDEGTLGDQAVAIVPIRILAT